MTHRISALISVCGVLTGLLLLTAAVRDYLSGASAVWIAAGALILLVTSCTLARDVRRLRTGAAS
ncbi:hypothetical protein ACFWBV_20950 [Streptomyces sp. NPDC060030]|uniref:hypothetical protein n=1 Tax=Streptomyces sp. NPDC060030 TaxID=3347042 RepID=UPI0036930D39